MTSIANLRLLCIIEGISLLLLLGIAMPLKYAADWPWGVRYVGMIHGILWLALCGQLLVITLVHRWPVGRAVAVFVSSLVPFGFALIDRRLRGWQQTP